MFGAELARHAFSSLPGGHIFLLLSLTLFAFSTLVGWSYYTAEAVRFFVRGRVEKPVYIAWLAVMCAGGFLSPKLVWELADTAIAVMCVPNLLSLWLLRGVVFSETKKYLNAELSR